MANEIFKLTINRAGPNVVESWFDHFKRVGRPAGIVRHCNDDSVWRQGAKLRHDPRFPRATDAPVGILIKAVHGFEQLWDGEKSLETE